MKIGIFGGTFDPPHIGHINICKQFLEALSLDKLYVIPAFLPPHKQIKSSTSVSERFEMCHIAFSNISEKIEISDVEIKREGKSYTADTIAYFKSCGANDLYLLCGTDMLLTLDEWYNPEYIFENATIVFARRENEELNAKLIHSKIKQYEEDFNAKIITLNVNVIEASSSEIREKISKDEPCGLLTVEIFSYIKKNQLYR